MHILDLGALEADEAWYVEVPEPPAAQTERATLIDMQTGCFEGPPGARSKT